MAYDEPVFRAPGPTKRGNPYDEALRPLERNLSQSRRNLSRLGVETSEEKPGLLSALFSPLGIVSSATTSAYRYGKSGRDPLAGLLEGGYAAIRPTLVQAGFKPRKSDVTPEFWSDVLQDMPGLEPTESTLRNFGVRLLGTLIDIGIDPLTYVSFGGGGAIKTGIKALKRQGVRGAAQLMKTPEGRKLAAQALADIIAVKQLKSGEKVLSDVAKGMKGSTDEIEKLLNLEWKNKGPINLGVFFGGGPQVNLVSYEKMSKTGIPDVFEAVFSPRGTKIIATGVDPQAMHWIKPEVVLPDSPLANLFFYKGEQRMKFPQRVVRPLEQTLLPDMIGVPPVLQGAVNLSFEQVTKGQTLAKVVPEFDKTVTFWHRRPGLTVLDSLTTPISTLYRQSPWLTEKTRQYRNNDIVMKHGAITQFSEPWVKMVPEKEMENIPFYIELQKAANNPDLAANPELLKHQQKFDQFISKHGQKKWDEIRGFWDDWFSNERLPDGSFRGRIPTIINDATNANNFLDDYVTHMYLQHPERQEAVATIQDNVKFSLIDKYMKTRDIDTLFEAVESGLRPETNSAVVGTNRIIAAQRAIAKRQYMDVFVREGLENGTLVPYKMGDKLPDGYFNGSNFDKTFPQLRGYAVREDAIIHLGQNFQTHNNVAFLGLMQKLTNMWKPFVTAYNPKFHLRNMLGSGYNNFLGGITNPDAYLDALRVQAPGLQEVLGKIDVNGMDAAQIRKLAFENGILGRGWIATDIERTVREDVLAMKKNYNPAAWYAKGSRAAGTVIEDNARLTMFIDRLKKGYTVADAADDVKKFHFNYDELAPFERKLRIFFPFYSWAKNNVPLQIEHLFKKPGKFAAIPKIQAGIEGKEGRKKREDLAADWMKNNQVIYGGELKNGKIRMIAPGMPYEDLTNYLQGRALMSSLNPFIKLFVEGVTGYDFFAGRPYVKKGLENEPKYHVSRVNNQYANVIPKQFWPLLGMGQYTDPNGDVVTYANVRLYNIWKAMARPAREAIKLSDPEEELFDRVLNQFTGLTVTDVDPARAKFFKMLEELTSTQEIMKQEQNRRSIPWNRRRR